MWLLIAFQLPSDPGYLRVKIWRRLQSVGAVSIRNALYVLPAGEAAEEDLQWVLREVRAAGGEGALFAGELRQGMSEEALRGLFDAAREADYAALAEEMSALTGAAAGSPGEVARCRRRLAEIEAIDFFGGTTGRQVVHALLRGLEQRLSARTGESTMENQTAARRDLRGRVWVTRAHVKVDRMASAWLIRRFIDPEATFRFVAERAYSPAADELRFDMYEGEYTHDAERCTFEVLLDLTDKDPGLEAIGAIVHDLDLKDGRYGREETAGVRQLLQGIMAGSARDEERLERSGQLFDDLYRSFSAARAG